MCTQLSRARTAYYYYYMFIIFAMVERIFVFRIYNVRSMCIYTNSYHDIPCVYTYKSVRTQKRYVYKHNAMSVHIVHI